MKKKTSSGHRLMNGAVKFLEDFISRPYYVVLLVGKAVSLRRIIEAVRASDMRLFCLVTVLVACIVNNLLAQGRLGEGTPLQPKEIKEEATELPPVFLSGLEGNIRERISELEEACRTGNVDEVFSIYTELIERIEQNPSYIVVDEEGKSGIGLRLYIESILDSMSRDAFREFEAKVDAVLSPYLDAFLSSIAGRRDGLELIRISSRYAMSVRARQLMRIAVGLAMEDGRYEEAAGVLKKLIEYSPQPEDIAMLARCYERLGNPNGIRELARIVSVTPSLSESVVRIGDELLPLDEYLVREEKNSQAGRHFARILSSWSGYDDAFSFVPAADFEPGAVRWRFRIPEPLVERQRTRAPFVQDPPLCYPYLCVANRRYVIFQDLYNVYAVHRDSGVLAWRFEDHVLSAEYTSPTEHSHAPILRGGYVYFVLHRDEGIGIYCVGESNGKLVWCVIPADEFPEGVKDVVAVGPPALYADTLCVPFVLVKGNAEVWVVGLDCATGKVRWKTFVSSCTSAAYAMRGLTVAQPLTQSGVLYLLTNLGTVAALNPLSGEILWVRIYADVSAPVKREILRRRAIVNHSRVVITDGRLIIAPRDAAIVEARDLTTGNLLWRIPRSGDATLAGADSELVYLITEDELRTCEISTGKLAWKLALGDDSNATFPFMVEEKLYVCADGYLVVVDTRERKVLLRMALSSSKFIKPLSGGGKYFGGNVLILDDCAIVSFESEIILVDDMKQVRARYENPLRQNNDVERYAEALVCRGRFEDALGVLGNLACGEASAVRTVACWGLAEEMIAVGHQERAIELLTDALRDADPKSKPALLLKLAHLKETVGDIPASISLYKECIEGLGDAEVEVRLRFRNKHYDVRVPVSVIARWNIERLVAKQGGGEEIGELAGKKEITVRESWRSMINAQPSGFEFLEVEGKPPADFGSFVLVGTNERIQARRVDSGEVLWDYLAGEISEVEEVAWCGDLLLFISSFEVLAIDARRGVPLWKYSLDVGEEGGIVKCGELEDKASLRLTDRVSVRGGVIIRACGVAGRVAVVCSDGKVVGIDSATGEQVWTVKLGGRPAHAIANPETLRVVVSIAGHRDVIGIDLESGRSMFEKKVGLEGEFISGRLLSLPGVLVGVKLYSPSEGGAKLAVLNCQSGEEVSLARIGKDVKTFIVPEGGNWICVVSEGKRKEVSGEDRGYSMIACLDILSGGILWAREVAGYAAWESYAMGRERLCVPVMDRGGPAILSIALADGGDEWRFHAAGGSGVGDLVLLQGLVFYTNFDDNTVRTLNEKTGVPEEHVLRFDQDGPSVLDVKNVDGAILVRTESYIACYEVCDFYAPAMEFVALLSGKRHAGEPPWCVGDVILDVGEVIRVSRLMYRRGHLSLARSMLDDAVTSLADSTEAARLWHEVIAYREAESERKKQVVRAYRFKTRPTIDGKLDERWREDEGIVLETIGSIIPVQGYEDRAEIWEGEEDLSMRIYTGWDEENFYVFVEVVDESYNLFDRDSSDWLGDTFIIYIDPEEDGGYSVGTDDQFLMLAHMKRPRKDDEEPPIPMQNCAVVRNDEEGITTYELAVPWDFINQNISGRYVTPSPGVSFGLNVWILDDDGQGAMHGGGIGPGLILHKNKFNGLYYPRYFPRVVLEE